MGGILNGHIQSTVISRWTDWKADVEMKTPDTRTNNPDYRNQILVTGGVEKPLKGRHASAFKERPVTVTQPSVEGSLFPHRRLSYECVVLCVSIVIVRSATRYES